MGLFDFVRDAGKKVFGDEKEEKEVATRQREAAGAAGEERKREQKKGELLAATVRAMDLPVEDLRVTFDDGTASVSGAVPDQRTREKVVLVIGNTQGVQRVDEDLEVRKPEPEATFYTVERGDTLSAIAKAHYGDGSKYPMIFEANRPMLEDPDRIYPGQVLRIPPA